MSRLPRFASRGKPLAIAAFAFSLAGIIVRNSILLVDFVNQQVDEGVDFQEAVIRAGAVRAKPIALTAVAAMLGAFFIATDPVSAATSDRGRLIYGAGIGVLTYVIRTWGGYPDGVAFAVLLMNMAVPAIDRYTVPRAYGHGR